MCGSMVDIQSATAEIRREKKEETRNKKKQCPHLLGRAAIKMTVVKTIKKKMRHKKQTLHNS